jgi:hypothetical protein
MTRFGVEFLQWNTNDYDDQKPVQKLCNGTQHYDDYALVFFFSCVCARSNPIVIHVAPYSAIKTAELVKMHVASPLIWRWVAKDIFWEEVQYGRVANTHGDTFATCA